MTREITANCKFCGQTAMVEVSDIEITLAKGDAEFAGMSEAEISNILAKRKAIQQCNCEGSNDHKKQLIRRDFEGFVGGDLLNFLELHKLEEITVKDCHGNKAKLKKKDSAVDVTKTLKDVF